jgi:hypothetical protein
MEKFKKAKLLRTSRKQLTAHGLRKQTKVVDSNIENILGEIFKDAQFESSADLLKSM